MQSEERRWKVITRPELLIITSGRNSQSTTWRKKPERKEQNGKLSLNARRKLKNAIRWLIASSPIKKCYEKKQKKTVEYRINMCTLTFKSNMQDDKLARLLLGKWLEMSKYRFSLEHYIWKAEPQERGAIHFHISSGLYLPYKEVAYTWNRLLFKHGIDQRNANSTDVHAVTNVQNLEAYLTEYLMNEDKHAGRRMIKGRLWGCSHALSQAGKEFTCLNDSERASINDELSQYHLGNRMQVPPDFLNFIDVYCLPENYWKLLPDCELKRMYQLELEKLSPTVRQKEFW